MGLIISRLGQLLLLFPFCLLTLSLWILVRAFFLLIFCLLLVLGFWNLRILRSRKCLFLLCFFDWFTRNLVLMSWCCVRWGWRFLLLFGLISSHGNNRLRVRIRLGLKNFFKLVFLILNDGKLRFDFDLALVISLDLLFLYLVVCSNFIFLFLRYSKF